MAGKSLLGGGDMSLAFESLKEQLQNGDQEVCDMQRDIFLGAMHMMKMLFT
jgi:hypothetical protein